jgi:haloacetate dehalogenase
MVEDCRAGLGVDRAADEADMEAGRRVEAPVLFLWASRDDLVPCTVTARDLAGMGG